MKKMVLRPKKESSIRRFHPWIFSGAVAQQDEDIVDGDLVEVYQSNGNYLATGHYQDASIKVRIVSFEQSLINEDFWREKIQTAYSARNQLGFINNSSTNCYRLIHAEGDGCPGLIIDVFDRTAVIQCHSIGMHRQIKQLASALVSVLGKGVNCIYDKSKKTLPTNYARNISDACLYGEATEELIILENNHSFLINYQTGQKTGFFLDQRNNRALLSKYASRRKVLNAFCYTGGFSVYALQAGAQLVHSVDASEKAIDLCRKNVALNSSKSGEHHKGFVTDVHRFLKNITTTYDLIILDPPAFAKKISKRHNAVQGYKRINAEALKQIEPGGILFTFSCSQVIDRLLFQSTLLAAAIEAGRQVSILHHLSQPPDHPVSLFHPEGAYLKGLVLRVI